MPQLDFSTYFSQLFWLFITFIFMYGIIASLVVPSVKKIKQERQAFIDSNIKEAEDFQAAIVAERNKYENEIEEAEKVVLGILADAELEIEDIKARKKEELENSIVTLSLQNEEKILNFKKHCNLELEKTVEVIAKVYWNAMLAPQKIQENRLQQIIENSISDKII